MLIPGTYVITNYWLPLPTLSVTAVQCAPTCTVEKRPLLYAKDSIELCEGGVLQASAQ